MKLFSKTLSVLSTLALVSCMGGTTDRSNGNTGSTEDVTFGSSITGQFVDAPVNGLNYYINTNSATISQTSGEGNFTCNVGDSVTFVLGQNLVLGTAACGSLVAPTYFGTAIADKIAVTLQNISSTSGALLDVSAAANETFAITNISAVDATTIGPVLAKVGRSLSTDYAAAVTAARTAMNNYLQTVSQIPEAYRNNTYTFNVTANLVNGNRDLCDDVSRFKTVVTVGESSADVKFYGVEDDGTTVTPEPILQSVIYSTVFHVGGSINDEDETYFVNGSGSFNAQGFSGTYVETVTAAEEQEYVGVSCAYSFSNVAPESDDEPGESDAE